MALQKARNRWLDWTPKKAILPDTPEIKPSKPTEPVSFVGIDGLSQSASANISSSAASTQSMAPIVLSEEKPAGTEWTDPIKQLALPLAGMPDGIQTLTGANCRVCGDRRKWRLGPNQPFNCITCHPPVICENRG